MPATYILFILCLCCYIVYSLLFCWTHGLCSSAIFKVQPFNELSIHDFKMSRSFSSISPMLFFIFIFFFQCDICLLFYSDDQIPPGTSCNHKFCHSCWSQYLTSKIQDGNAHSILCPAFNCHILIAPDFIDKILPAELTKKYLHFDIKVKIPSSFQFFSFEFRTNKWMKKISNF